MKRVIKNSLNQDPIMHAKVVIAYDGYWTKDDMENSIEHAFECCGFDLVDIEYQDEDDFDQYAYRNIVDTYRDYLDPTQVNLLGVKITFKCSSLPVASATVELITDTLDENLRSKDYELVDIDWFV